uniref:Nuclear pore complex protein Nup155 n=1 Tax=Aceria tosichella TaxID=561515 RepID=A0A6G1SEV7_9ACAR
MTSPQVWSQISVAAEKIQQNLQADSRFKTLSELLRATPHQPSLSGLQDIDYPNMKFRVPIISNINKVALPTEVIEQYINMRQNCALGIFPEISRAWLSVDSCIFFWAYDNASDVAYYDGLDQTILAVHLLKPRPNVFKSHIKYILCLITASEITLLGVTCPEDDVPGGSSLTSFLLIPDPLFKISTENVILSVVAGTDDGRIFISGNDGCLYEIFYQAEDGWFSRKCRKINHSHSLLSYVTPSFLNFGENEPIVQIEIDNSRRLLFARTDKSTLQLYDLGSDGNSVRLVASKSLSAVVNQASCIARTIDTSNFKPIVGIKALTHHECENINLVAVTQAGVRMYFSASGADRPSSFDLVHVRLPPGFTPSSAVQRPNAISNIYQKDNTYIMSSPQTENKDFLWILSNDYYVYEDQMMEAFGINSLEGRVWSIAEEIHESPSRFANDIINPPLIVKQHFEERRKFILLTSEGVFIFYKQRPIDQLSLLLTETQNPDSPAVRSFFQSTKLAEACLTSLILASSSNVPQEIPLVEWSTLAFFKFGSTQVDSNFSARHDAIYLYLSRILRPLWQRKAAEETDVTPFLKRLVELKKFIENNSHIVGDQNIQPKITLKAPMDRENKWTSPLRVEPRNTLDIASESESLSSLICLLNRCIEVLNLYKLLCDHGFSVNLPQEPQLRLSVMTFRDLIVIGGDMTTSIASALVRRYLDENTSTDAICRRLHELCPTIFRHENSLQARAHEMILQSRSIADKVEKERIMNESVAILKKIGSRLDLNSVCDLLHSARAFKYIVEICLFVADKRDPLNYAGYHQSSKILNTTLDEAEERARLNAVSLRMECYMRIIETLDRLMNSEDFSEVFQACVKSTDEIFHTKLYEWLCEKNLSSKLLEVQSPFIESFLKKKAESDCYSTHHLDLMWRFYERRGNFFGAAQILDKLACKPCTDYELEERLAYLSRAKSCVEAMSSPGEYLHELEEKMEVVRIQIQVYRSLKLLPESHSIQESLNRLNYSLSDLTTLYQDYAQKFNLYDCQLAILKCGNHHDPSLVEKLWKCIIDEVYNNTQGELPDTQLHILGNRIESLGKSLMPSERFFPAYFIIAYLEYKTYKYDNLRWVPQCLMRIGFKPLNLLEPYHKFYKSREHSVYWPGKQIHALRVIATLIEDTLDRSDKSFATACLDVICDYLIDLQTMAPDSNVRRLQDTFTVLQKRINDRMLN